MTHSDAPPPRRRAEVSASERAAIEAVTGPLTVESLRAVRDARGRDFQRLEFLGDSVLDVLMSAHAVLSPRCEACAETGGNVARLVTDAALATSAAKAGLGSWLEWRASRERLADLVETCIAAGWVSGGWDQAIRVTELVVHRLDGLGEIFAGQRHLTVQPSKASRRVGAALLELAAAAGAYNLDPTADEAQLSSMRAAVHRAERIAAFASATSLVSTAGEPAQVSDRVEEEIARTLWLQGAGPAFTLADRALYS